MTAPPRRTGRRRGQDGPPPPQRQVDYHNLKNPFPPVRVFSDDRIEAIHQTSLRVLEELGVKILLPEARRLFRAAGARVDEASEMVWIGREIINAALKTAPHSITLRAATRARDVTLELGRLVFQPGAGAPHATDLVRGRRPGTLSDFRDFVQLTQHFDALQIIPPVVEPQDIPTHLRHYAMTDVILTQSDKVPFVYGRGSGQAKDCFEMIRDFRGLSDAEFSAEPHSYTIVNTNSPRQIDIPMAMALVDFARSGQLVVVTPFTLMGAMAPITVAGALTLSHAEAMAAITLTQLARPGAPVTYGTFTSGVDMRSGAPAMGTPEQVKATMGAGQLARKLGLPWRCAAGSAANINDVQAAHETELSAWGCLTSGTTLMIHSAGWLEAGLTVSYEKLITDMEMVQSMAELCQDTPAGLDEIGFDAVSEVDPGGHFFATAQTMERYQTAFYDPLVADYANFGTWTDRGSVDANTRATAIWQNILANFTPPKQNENRVSALRDFINRRTADGGAPPES